MNRILDDGRTIVSDSYAPYGELPQFPAKLEPTPEEREAERARDRIRYSELVKLFADFDRVAAQAGFPKPLTYSITGRVFVRREAIYSRQQLNDWMDAQRAIVASFPARPL